MTKGEPFRIGLVVAAVTAVVCCGCAEHSAWPFDSVEAARRQDETAARLGVPKELALDCGNGVEMTFVLIPSGEFVMGSRDSEAEVARKSNLPYRVDADLRQAEHPPHRVRITRAFYMSVTEVTRAQYVAVTGGALQDVDGPTHPVAWVSWEGAVAFCRQLSGRSGRAVRLPTEAQWEYACRAGTATPFHTGETISTDQANYHGHGIYGDGRKGVFRGQATPVGSFPANAWGLHDMHGNVYEWCTDWSDGDYYATSAVDDPQGPSLGATRIIRGGSCDNVPAFVRSAFRNWAPPEHLGDTLGFRVVVDLE